MHRIHHLVALHTVHRTGSFAVAARELGYTASAISQQIAALERDTGLVLFERGGGRRPRHRLRRPARRAEPAAARRGGRVRPPGPPPRHRGGGPDPARRLPDRGRRRGAAGAGPPRRHLAGREVSLEEGEPDDLAAAVADGRLDVALVYEYGPCPRRWPADVTVTPLLRERLLLLRSAAHGAADLTSLAGRPWIASGPGTAGALSLSRLCAEAGFTPDVVFRSNNYDVVRELVATTGGAAVVPALGHRPDPRITATPLTQPTAHRTVLAARRTGSTNPVLPAFVDLLRTLDYRKLTFCASVSRSE